MLNLYEILENILKESVSPSQIVDAINNKYQVIIQYSDEQNRAPQTRLIEPYVYGISKAGNSVIRAYQYNGDSFRGTPHWKLFRLDRITSWKTTKNHFNAEPQERGWNAEKFNRLGDKSMSTVLSQVSLDYDDTNNPYIKGSELYKIRRNRDIMKKSQPININQFGPVISNDKNNNQPVNNQNDNGPIINNDDEKLTQ